MCPMLILLSLLRLGVRAASAPDTDIIQSLIDNPDDCTQIKASYPQDLPRLSGGYSPTLKSRILSLFEKCGYNIEDQLQEVQNDIESVNDTATTWSVATRRLSAVFRSLERVERLASSYLPESTQIELKLDDPVEPTIKFSPSSFDLANPPSPAFKAQVKESLFGRYLTCAENCEPSQCKGMPLASVVGTVRVLLRAQGVVAAWSFLSCDTAYIPVQALLKDSLVQTLTGKALTKPQTIEVRDPDANVTGLEHVVSLSGVASLDETEITVGPMNEMFKKMGIPNYEDDDTQSVPLSEPLNQIFRGWKNKFDIIVKARPPPKVPIARKKRQREAVPNKDAKAAPEALQPATSLQPAVPPPLDQAASREPAESPILGPEDPSPPQDASSSVNAEVGVTRSKMPPVGIRKAQPDETWRTYAPYAILIGFIFFLICT